MPASVPSRESMAQAHASVRNACAPKRLAPLQLTWSKGGFKPYVNGSFIVEGNNNWVWQSQICKDGCAKTYYLYSGTSDKGQSE